MGVYKENDGQLTENFICNNNSHNEESIMLRKRESNKLDTLK